MIPFDVSRQVLPNSVESMRKKMTCSKCGKPAKVMTFSKKEWLLAETEELILIIGF